MQFTKRQAEVLRTPLKRINILEGSVRSGKTYFTCYIWGLHMLETRRKYPEISHNFIMVAKTITSLRRNILDLMVDIWGRDVFNYSLSAKTAYFDGMLIHLEGVSDSRAESKIRGMTLSGALCEELTLFTEDFFSMLLSRLSVKGAKLIGSTNPDHPNHWLKVKYIDRAEELSLANFKFTIDDNTTLDPEYIENLKKEYTGVYYKRFIQGLWCNAEGLIYELLAENESRYICNELPGDIMYVQIGVDFGGNGSATTFNTTGIRSGFKGIVVLDEWHYKGKELTPTELDNAFIEYIKRQQYPIKGVFMDSAETVLINGLKGAAMRHGLPVAIKNAQKGEIANRIRFMCKMLSYDKVLFYKDCKHTIDAFSSAMWNSKSMKLERLDDGSTNIDNIDSTEYSIESVMKYFN